MSSGESVPKDHRIQRVASEMDKLRQDHGAEKFDLVEGLASRWYEVNRAVLAMAHANGLLTDEDYKKCLARGNDYAPVCFIMNDLLE
jgi:hypothetical protein